MTSLVDQPVAQEFSSAPAQGLLYSRTGQWQKHPCQLSHKLPSSDVLLGEDLLWWAPFLHPGLCLTSTLDSTDPATCRVPLGFRVPGPGMQIYSYPVLIVHSPARQDFHTLQTCLLSYSPTHITFPIHSRNLHPISSRSDCLHLHDNQACFLTTRSNCKSHPPSSVYLNTTYGSLQYHVDHALQSSFSTTGFRLRFPRWCLCAIACACRLHLGLLMVWCAQSVAGFCHGGVSTMGRATSTTDAPRTRPCSRFKRQMRIQGIIADRFVTKVSTAFCHHR